MNGRLPLQKTRFSEILHQFDLLPNVPPWNQFWANSLSQLKLTRTPTGSAFQLVLASFSFEPEIDLKALVQCLLLLVQNFSFSKFSLVSAACFPGDRLLGLRIR